MTIASVTSGPATATLNSSPGVALSRLMRMKPPKKNSSMPVTSMPTRRAATACPSSCSRIEPKNSRATSTAPTKPCVELPSRSWSGCWSHRMARKRIRNHDTWTPIRIPRIRVSWREPPLSTWLQWWHSIARPLRAKGSTHMAPTKVTVTGAAGAIGYAILFRIASGQMLGPDTPVALRLLEIPDAVKAAEGTAMELVDCAFPLLASIDIFDDAREAFDGANVGLLIGARPRTKGMERADLLEANGGIFKPQGEAINAGAADDVKVLVVGNPANTNALIAQSNAPDVPRERFTAMTRLDHNRAIAQLARKANVQVSDIPTMGVWGHHSPTMCPDLFNAKVGGKSAAEVVDDQEWYANDFLPTVGKRGAAIIDARGASSAASAANAAIDHVHDWVNGTAEGDWVSMAVPSDGSYDVPEGIISSFPCRCSGGEWEIVQGLDVPDFSRERIAKTVGELQEERAAVEKLGLV